MRPAVLLLAAGLLTAGCSPQTSTSPSGVPSDPATEPSGPALSRIWLCCGSNNLAINEERQIEARATYADGSIKDVTSAVTSWRSSNPEVATISSTGVVRGLAAGNFDVFASYHGFEATWNLYVYVSPRTGPPGPGEVIGRVHEVTPGDDIGVAYAQVAISGGEHHGRVVTADSGGHFRIDGIQRAGFDLVASRSGYRPGRYRVVELPRDASASIALEPEPWLVSDVFEGVLENPACFKSKSLLSRTGGLFRLTSFRTTIFEGPRILLLANGVEQVFFQTDYSMQPGIEYELKVTNPAPCSGGITAGPFRLTFLRPR